MVGDLHLTSNVNCFVDGLYLLGYAFSLYNFCCCHGISPGAFVGVIACLPCQAEQSMLYSIFFSDGLSISYQIDKPFLQLLQFVKVSFQGDWPEL